MKQVLFNLLLAFFISGGVATAATNTLHDKPLKTAPTSTDETYVWDTGTSTLKKTTFAPFLVGDCTGFPCLDGTSDGGNYIKLWAGTGSYWTALQGGSPAANRSWRLPIAAPPAAGATYIMNMDEYGQMGFVAPSSFLTPTGSGAALTIDASGFDGNLTTSDNTLQEVSQKVDDLIVGGGGYTNLTEFVGQTAWRLFYSDGSGDVKELSLGSDGEYLKSNGAAVAPSWATPSGAAHDAVTLGTDADAVLGLSAQQITLDSQTANTVFASPNGSAGDPTFRALVATDIPTLNQSTTGNAATATVLASDPTDCASGQYATTIAANGNLTCGQVAYSQVSGTPTSPTYGTGVVSALGYAPDASGGFLLANTYLADPKIAWDTATIIETVDSPVAGTNKIGVKPGVFQSYDANMIIWPSAISAEEIAYLDGLTEAISTSLSARKKVVVSDSSALATTSIAANTCSLQSFTATGAVAATDKPDAYISGRLSTVNGFGVTSAGSLRIDVYLTDNSINFDVCNPTSDAITPGALTIKWDVLR